MVEKRKLAEGEINAASGGYLVDARSLDIFNRCYLPYYVVDLNGDVIGNFNTKKEAMEYAIECNISCKEISWEQFEELKRHSSPPSTKRARKS